MTAPQIAAILAIDRRQQVVGFILPRRRRPMA
jgi:hypothetical protein